MRAHTVTAAMGFWILASTAACFAEESRAESINTILKKLESLRSRLDAAETRLRAIEKRRRMADFFPGFSRNRGHRAPYALYADLNLPPDATPDQARQYVREIKRRNAPKDCYFSRDPEAELLAKVGKRNLMVILEEMDDEESDTFFTSHAVAAVRMLADDDQVGIVVGKLLSCPKLAQVILDKGWESQAREVLLDGLSYPNRPVPEEWIKALARLRDPRTYDAILGYMKTDNRFEMVYRYVSEIEDLPREDLDVAVQAAWDKYSRNEGSIPIFMKDSAATIAVRHGHVNALGYLLELLLREDRKQFPNREIRELVLSLVPLEGTNEELRDWFDQHCDRLAFDRKSRKYFIKER